MLLCCTNGRDVLRVHVHLPVPCYHTLLLMWHYPVSWEMAHVSWCLFIAWSRSFRQLEKLNVQFSLLGVLQCRHFIFFQFLQLQAVALHALREHCPLAVTTVTVLCLCILAAVMEKMANAKGSAGHAGREPPPIWYCSAFGHWNVHSAPIRKGSSYSVFKAVIPLNMQVRTSFTAI